MIRLPGWDGGGAKSEREVKSGRETARVLYIESIELCMKYIRCVYIYVCFSNI